MFTFPWLLAAVSFMVDQWLMTSLIRHQYEEHRALWERDGQPRPMFWIPPETLVGRWYLTYRSGRAFHIVSWRWLFKMPEWIRDSRDTRRLLVAHRLLVAFALLCVLAPFIIAVATQ